VVKSRGSRGGSVCLWLEQVIPSTSGESRRTAIERGTFEGWLCGAGEEAAFELRRRIIVGGEETAFSFM